MKPTKSESQKMLYLFYARLMDILDHRCTTVQKKAVDFPADARLDHKSRLLLVRMGWNL